MFYKNEKIPKIRSNGTDISSLLYLNSRPDFGSLKYVFSVKLDLLPGNTQHMAIDLFVESHNLVV